LREVQGTVEGRVRWRASRFGAAVLVSGSQFEIWSGTDEETDKPVVSFALQESKSKPLDTGFVDRGDEHYEYMHDLFSRARRQALGIPERLAAIRDALNSSTVIGEEPGKDDDVPF
jgi:hypothetical protein